MKFGLRKLALVIACVAAALAMPGSTGASTSGTIVIPYDPFPPFADVGTIVEFGVEADGFGIPGAVCRFWRDDSGSLFFFNGLDDFNVGDRVMVSGQICLICLVYNECGIPASAIINAEARLVVPRVMQGSMGADR